MANERKGQEGREKEMKKKISENPCKVRRKVKREENKIQKDIKTRKREKKWIKYQSYKFKNFFKILQKREWLKVKEKKIWRKTELKRNKEEGNMIENERK